MIARHRCHHSPFGRVQLMSFAPLLTPNGVGGLGANAAVTLLDKVSPKSTYTSTFLAQTPSRVSRTLVPRGFPIPSRPASLAPPPTRARMAFTITCTIPDPTYPFQNRRPPVVMRKDAVACDVEVVDPRGLPQRCDDARRQRRRLGPPGPVAGGRALDELAPGQSVPRNRGDIRCKCPICEWSENRMREDSKTDCGA